MNVAQNPRSRRASRQNATDLRELSRESALQVSGGDGPSLVRRGSGTATFSPSLEAIFTAGCVHYTASELCWYPR